MDEDCNYRADIFRPFRSKRCLRSPTPTIKINRLIEILLWICAPRACALPKATECSCLRRDVVGGSTMQPASLLLFGLLDIAAVTASTMYVGFTKV